MEDYYRQQICSLLDTLEVDLLDLIYRFIKSLRKAV